MPYIVATLAYSVIRALLGACIMGKKDWHNFGSHIPGERLVLLLGRARARERGGGRGRKKILGEGKLFLRHSLTSEVARGEKEECHPIFESMRVGFGEESKMEEQLRLLEFVLMEGDAT